MSVSLLSLSLSLSLDLLISLQDKFEAKKVSNTSSKLREREMRRAGMMKLLSAVEAKRVDEELMGPVCGFRLEQLMELAGLSVACAARRLFPPESFGRPLLLCGKGNNGELTMPTPFHLSL